MLTKTIKLCILAVSILCTSVFAAPILTALPPLTVNVAGTPSYGLPGDPGNTVMYFNVGANTTVTAITWNVQLSAYVDSSQPALSWLSDMMLEFGDSAQSTNRYLRLGEDDDFPGTKTYSGTDDLAASGAFNVGGDGLLRVAFFELTKDFPVGFADGGWDAGTLTFDLARAVPEPDSVPLIGLALLLLALNRRRRAASVAV